MVERRGRLVEQQDRGRAQQSAGQRHPLALTRAEGEPVLSQRGLEAAGQMGHEAVEPDDLAHGAQRLVGGGAGPEAQVLGHRRREQIRTLGHPREVGAPLRRRDPRRLPAVDGHGPGGARCETEQGVEHGGLAGSRRPDQRDPRPGRRVEGERGQRGGGAVVVLDAESLEAQMDGVSWRSVRRGPRLGRRARPGRPVCGEGQDLEHPGRRRLPFCAGVELGPGPAEGDEDFRGDQEHSQRGLEAELVPEEAQAQDHGHQADPEPGDEVHGEGGEEGHPQRAHGGDAHPFGGFDDLTATVPVAPEGPQRGQSLNELEEPPGQRAQAAPLPRRAPVRLPSEVDHGHRHGDHQGHDDDQREPVLRGHPDQKDQRHHRGHGRLGEIAGEIGMERTQPARGGERELTGPFPGQPGGP